MNHSIGLLGTLAILLTLVGVLVLIFVKFVNTPLGGGRQNKVMVTEDELKEAAQKSREWEYNRFAEWIAQDREITSEMKKWIQDYEAECGIKVSILK